MSSLKNSKKIIETWKEKGNKENDEFSKFICYWIAFNCWLYTITDEIGDRNALIKLYKKSSTNNKFKKLVCDNKNNLKDKVKNLKEVCPIKNNRKNGCEKTISKADDFEEVMNVIYEIRCNLFHGSKSDEDLRDSEVIKGAVPVLEIIVKNLCI